MKKKSPAQGRTIHKASFMLKMMDLVYLIFEVVL
jgi:hypothetical protein